MSQNYQVEVSSEPCSQLWRKWAFPCIVPWTHFMSLMDGNCLRAFHPLFIHRSQERKTVRTPGRSHRYLSSSPCPYKKTCKLCPEWRDQAAALSSSFWVLILPGVPKGLPWHAASDESRPVSGEGLGGVSVKCHRCEGEWRTKEKPSHSECKPSSKKDHKWPNQVFNWKESKEVSLGTETF